ncbi:N-alpha-acetyltransferase 25, NatB auxiliary subunit [Gracilariopsis chorda]|uniref:N-alpha-acetyltransferase 25, NatB auxiliary subunit n=1 Tax=Gracilariopsis chorda TaxID=448386 RepID=A0A2V3INY9_9FLOR|nr:N-alpha-acetyltransferase 25, NatB auxiliary subunit [Gracilariopsis chorda]|eukprot:PXF43798.1 N-alpha-acetyltransferase 25, NatB auxiliary subunit [Gracilariopsis chorda]
MTGKSLKSSASVVMKTPISRAESDRRLRPVLDNLSEHNTKQAFKLVQQALQKRPGWPAARALRACVYLQMRKLKQAEDEIANLRNDLDAGRVPTDEDVAEKIQYYYRESGNEAGTGEVYELVWKADASQFQLAEAAFCYYIRGYAFNSAQKLATKLHRMTSSNTEKYGLWATAAIWLGVVYRNRDLDTNQSSSDDRMLTLASRMLEKSLDVAVTPSAETTRFAVRIHRDANEHEKALRLISHRRLVMDEAEVLHIKSGLHTSGEQRMKDYSALLSDHDCDDWGHWLSYLECVESGEACKDEAMAFIDRLVEVQSDGRVPKRAPFLAQMEFYYRHGETEALGKAISIYFSLFGAKTVCAHDLRPYLTLISDTLQFQKALERIRSIGNEKGFPYHLTASWLCLWFNELTLSPAELMEFYSSSLSDTLESTDRQDGDDYLILITHRLLPIFEKDLDDRYANKFAVLQTIAVLETGLTRSPHNFHFKLLLIRLYIELGAMERVAELWESLEIKHVQMSTLTHLVLKPFFETGHHDALSKVFEGMETLWRECDLEIPQCVTKALEFGSINAAIEFVLFRQRLERSAVLIEGVLTKAQVALVQSAGDAAGLDLARDCLSFFSRFTPGKLETKRIVDTDDTRCFQFWDLQCFDPEMRLSDKTNEHHDEGVTCQMKRKSTIISDLKSLMTLMQVLNDETIMEASASAGIDGAPVNGHAPSGAEHLSMLRKRISDNLQNVKGLLVLFSSGALLNDAAEVPKNLDPMDLLSTAKGVVEDVHHEVEDAIKEPKHSNGLKGTMSPVQLRKCCRMSFEILLLASLAIASFSAELMRGKNRRKRGSTKSAKLHAAQYFNSIQEAIHVHKVGVVSACSLMQEWISCSLDQGADWLDGVCDGERTLSASVPYLPNTIHPISLSDGSKQKGGPIDRSAFCHDILERTRSSHMATCTRLLEVLSGITRTLKLVDV